jgi:YD repeat-containing protein
VKAAMGYTDEHVESLAIQPFPSASSISQLAAIIKNSLPTAQVTSYTYKPLVGIEIITAPNGTSTTYKYDNAGRLSGIEGPDGRINELYEYHYKP